MSNVFENFLNELEAVGSVKAAKTYRSLLNSFHEWLKEERISAKGFDRSDVRDFLEQISWANSSKNTFLQALKSWASYQEDEIPVGTTVEEMQQARRQEKRLRSLQKMRRYKTGDNEVETLQPEKLQYLLESSEPRKACLFYFYFYTGFRLREIQRIRDIEWANGEGSMGVIRVLTEKTDEPREVPFHAKAGGVIARILEEGWHKLHPDTIGGFFREKKPAFSIDFTTHTARRTFRTEMKDQGVEKIVVKKLLGHNLGDITDSSYLKIDFSDLAQAMREDHYFNRIDVPYRRLL